MGTHEMNEKVTINAMAVDKDGNTVPCKVTVRSSDEFTMKITGMPDDHAKVLLLKALTAIQTCGCLLKGGVAFEISEMGTRPAMLTVPVAIAYLIATGQVNPVPEIGDMIMCGDLKLDGEIIEMYNTGQQERLLWPFDGKNILTDHKKMHLVPEGVDLGLRMTAKGPYTVEVSHLNQILKIISR